MSEDFNERYRQALRLIRECGHSDLKEIQEVVNHNIQVIEDERKRVKKVEVIEVGHYVEGAYLPCKWFDIHQLDEAKEYVKKMIDDEKIKTLKVYHRAKLVYPDELEEMGLSDGSN